MSEEGAAKLRLKARKAPAACSREPSPGREPPRRRQTLTDRGSWFEKDDINECEKPWILLLKDIGQDLQCTNWQTVPSFPEFPGKSSKEENLQEHEVFRVGMKDFQWVSFPSFCKEKHLLPEDLSSAQLLQSYGQDQADELESLPSTAEKTHCVTTIGQAKTMAGADAKGISELDASPKSCKLTQYRNSAPHLALSQSSTKAFSFQQHCRRTVQNSREKRKENDRKELQLQTHQRKISFAEARYGPAEKKPLVSVPGPESCKEMGKQSEASTTLDSCPMCLTSFSGKSRLNCCSCAGTCSAGTWMSSAEQVCSQLQSFQGLACPNWISMAILPGACPKVQMMYCGKSRRMKSKGARPRMNLSQRKRKNVSRKHILFSCLRIKPVTQ